MSFESDLKSHLGHSSITALVSDRVYPVIAPQGAAVPRVVYTPLAPDQVNNLDGRDNSLRFIQVQIDCWAETFDEVVSIATAIRARMDTAASSFRAVLLPGAGFDDFEVETRLFRRSLEFNCSFTET